MESNKKKGRNVICQHPFMPNSNFPLEQQRSAIVYPFNKETIEEVVPDDIVCGNYMLGELDKDNMFSVFYVGRATKRRLKERIAEHLKELPTYSNVYFSFEEKASEEEAYHQECKDYHYFSDSDVDGYLQNENHPAKPAGMNTKCKICNQ